MALKWTKSNVRKIQQRVWIMSSMIFTFPDFIIRTKILKYDFIKEYFISIIPYSICMMPNTV